MGRSRDGYRKFVASGREVWVKRSFGNLRHNGPKDRIARCKCDAALDLDFKDSRVPAHIVSMDDNVVERVSLGRPLQLHAIDDGSGQAARFRATA